MEKLLEIGSKLGLEGKDLMKFVEEQQAYEREDCRKEREIRKLEVEREIEVKQLEEKRAQRRHEQELSESQKRHEIELRTLELQSASTVRRDSVDRAKAPKLQSFVDGKDELDSYLLRFERFATTNNWDRVSWAVSLSALLTGKALDVYSRMSDDAAIDYDQLKTALLKRYDFTEDGYRVKFRRAQPETGESPEQFIVRLGSYLQKWITLSNTEETLDGVCDLIVREQFINTCPRDLSIHLRERAPQNLQELAKIADQFLVAHGKQLYTTFQSGKDEKPISKEGGRRDYDPYTLQCFICRGYGHRAADCRLQMRAPRKRCYRCQRQGHEAKDCWSSTPTANTFTQKAAGAVYKATPEEVLQEDESCQSNVGGLYEVLCTS